MQDISGPPGEGISLYKHCWRFFVAIGMVLTMLIAFFSCVTVAAPLAFAVSHTPLVTLKLTSSPTQGPVGAVIAVTGSDLNYPDGTKINLGYTIDRVHCVAASGGQSTGAINNHTFSGWFTWPTSTGMGPFAVCAWVTGSNSSAIVGNYQVLSASAPQIAITPTIPNAAKTATVTGANFLPAGTSVDLVWQSTNGSSQPLALGPITTDNTGAFSQTFTVPSNTSTGSYEIAATAGTNQPPTLSASTTFHVDGITIAPVSTPGAQASPTLGAGASPTVNATSAITPVSTVQPQKSTATGGQPLVSGMLLPIILVGVLVIILALTIGFAVVLRHRKLVALAADARVTAASLPVPQMAGFGATPASNMGSAALSPAGNPGSEQTPRPVRMPNSGAMQGQASIPFDPGLAEAMRQAQVSVFAMPRPPIGEEILS